MSQYLRLYQSAVAPSDVEEMRHIFADEVAPVFAGCAGCLGVELAVSIEPNAGGLVEGAAISRWSSLDEMSAAMASKEVQGAIVAVRRLLRQEPVSKVMHVLQ
ncbi:MAG: hypothetical protein M3066_05250 [Actinomycetota bacterium]|nr:hypothetical protein [Actinomycetota bacterium]